ncbi:hypothetical protein SAMD00019534_025360 [Acytostelium subglobosum LB1]|uniref:hypothetical protein n=1 Tax=Acytostelium subglobosum LB1 TaxID=1410327 RepID=UPI000644801E|nr:hypothetical protein SAMD00019534_025360 [Acytostelium subglobosum LB1]GAM19361.1 hypothetical protein SAMD00019534_025360 [Acytostelium subglobosum LB1]|eukprot:XP_012757288.1 hypothetical protein SAMD00019534_025360 [Acytostelium subglobosum LB1]
MDTSMMNPDNNRVITRFWMLFGNKLIRTIIFQHVDHIHRHWIADGLSSRTNKKDEDDDQEQDNNNNDNNNLDDDFINLNANNANNAKEYPSIKSTIKGGKLYTDGCLTQMIKYNAVQWFIEVFDRLPNKSFTLTAELMYRSFKYNNTTIFNHILSRTGTNMGQLTNKWLINILERGNVEMFKAYLEVHTARTLPLNDSHLVTAIDTGNEHFVRLLLQHHCFEQPPEEAERLVLKRPGVSVNVLKVLHEDYDRLYHDDLWKMTLLHSIRSQQADSVQYIIDHLPPTKESTMIECIHTWMTHIVAHGNVAIINSISPRVFRYLLPMHCDLLSTALMVAIADGYEEVIKYLYTHHVGMGKGGMHPMAEITVVQHLFGESYVKVPKNDLNSNILAINTPSIVIIKDVIEQVDSHLQNMIYISTSLWRRMSKRMATHISNPRSRRLPLFNPQTLLSMLQSVGVPGSQVTEDMVLNFVDNCAQYVDPDSDQYATESVQATQALVLATKLSMTRSMQRIHGAYQLEYNTDCLRKALANDDFMALSIIFGNVLPTELDDWSNNEHVDLAADKLIAKSSLDTVTLVLKHLSATREDVCICEWAVFNSAPEVFQHIIKLFTFEEIVSNINDTIMRAFECDRPDVLVTLRQLYEDNGKTLPMPSLHLLVLGAKSNSLQALVYYLGTPEFANLPKIIRLRTLHAININAHFEGNVGIVNHTSELIKEAQANKKRGRDESEIGHNQRDDEDDAKVRVAASPRLETAIHKVFTDTKLIGLVMGHISNVHNSASVGEEQRVKGKVLLACNSLGQYNKFGASQWFLKAHQTLEDNNNRFFPNSNLLYNSMIMPNTAILDALLINPKMVYQEDGQNFLNDMFIFQSDCINPDWMRTLDQYLVNTLQDPKDIEIDIDMLLQIRHPSLLRKLIELGFEIVPYDTDTDKVHEMVEGWLLKPWALEMFKLLCEHSLIGYEVKFALLEEAICNNVVDVVRYIFEAEFDDMMIHDNSRPYSIVSQCMSIDCQKEIVDIVLSKIPLYTFPKDRQADLHREAARRGNLAMYIKLEGVCGPSNDYQRLSSALHYHGHMDLVNYILSKPPPPPNVHLPIHQINSTLISVELIQRLRAIPAIACPSASLMGHAIRSGKKDVIEFLRQECPPNDILAFEHALTYSDIPTARKILQSPEFIKQREEDRGLLGRHSTYALCIGATKMSDDDFIEFLKVMFNPEDTSELAVSDLLLAAVRKSSRVVKHVVALASTATDAIAIIKIDLFKSFIQVCINRADTESIECLVEMAVNTRQFSPRALFPLEIKNVSIVELILDKGYFTMDGSSYELARLVDWACENGQIDVLKTVYQRIATPIQLHNYLPTLMNVYKSAMENEHKVLAYLYEELGQILNARDEQLGRIHQAYIKRTMDYVLQGALLVGNINIIDMHQRLQSKYQ